MMTEFLLLIEFAVLGFDAKDGKVLMFHVLTKVTCTFTLQRRSRADNIREWKVMSKPIR